MTDTATETLREISSEELESVSGGAQHPLGWPDGLPLPHP